MASDGPPKSPTASSSADNPTSGSPPKYIPQFSAATEMILKRIQSGAVGSTSNLSSIGITGTPPGYEDMRRNVLMGMKTTLNMEIPSTPPSNRGRGGAAGRASSGGRAIAPRPSSTPSNGGGGSGSGGKRKTPRSRGARAGMKRKRRKSESLSSEESEAMSKLGGDSDSDDAESVTDLPKITQSGRQVVKPAPFVPAAAESHTRRRAPSKRTQENALCRRCGRGHSPQSNMIVFCDGCNLGWHQMCHDPPISEETVKDEAAPWYCVDCNRKKGMKSGNSDFQWKRSYFNSLPHQQLVSLLMQATVLHPNIPLFPRDYNPPSKQAQPAGSSDRRTNSPSQQHFPGTSTAGLFTRAESNPNATINFIRKIPGETTPPFSSSQQDSAHPASALLVANAQDGDSRESTPASPPYPKPGNGLMAKLGPDEDDMEWLVDNNDFNAFSHVMYDDHGERIQEHHGLPIMGEQGVLNA
ncbi:FYVE zinc finger [Venustampulla echinocandica]|uniref:FYVE zinc finger n=1 Tax=Venustampulla echinocandica TaxID=2656787 RepID=A0A370U2Z2_9HELO|nr:FYVE zinc finger [Venustampulla echinocandica]RDL42141.1 FYVE zinc finger [Venustampulla echinocandica]